MSISKYRDEDQVLLRTYCIQVISDPKVAIRDKNHAAKLLAWMQKLIQKSEPTKKSGKEEASEVELTDEQLEVIKNAVVDGELK